MFLDDEIASLKTGRNEARWGMYLAIAALAACILMLVGLITQAAAQTPDAKPQQMAGYVHPNDLGTGAAT